MNENTATEAFNSPLVITPTEQKVLPAGRYNLTITSMVVLEDAAGQPHRILMNFRAEAPKGFVIPPATFMISNPVGREILANLLWATGERGPRQLDQFKGLTVSACLYQSKTGWPTWGSWEAPK